MASYADDSRGGAKDLVDFRRLPGRYEREGVPRQIHRSEFPTALHF
jgi:hypothetical protein